MATLLEANEVTKIYAKGQRPSLNKVSFNVAESEFIAIMGASGSGKTTLLNVLSTIDTPTSGSIVINGVNLKQLSDTGSADFRRDNPLFPENSGCRCRYPENSITFAACTGIFGRCGMPGFSLLCRGNRVKLPIWDLAS